MLEIIIVEDVKKVRDTLVAMIEGQYKDSRIIAQTNNIDYAFNYIVTLKPNLVLLDIDLVDGTGFDLLERLPHKNFSLIFITGSSNRAIDAIKQGAIDYILKPISPVELFTAIDKVKELLNKEQINNTLQFVSANFKTLKPQKRLILKTAASIHSVCIADIIRCESEGKYTTFYLINEKKIVMSTPIKDYEEQLSPYGFFRIHQSHLINTLFFESLLKQLDTTILLTNGEKLPLASRKKIDFLKFIEANQ
jgi:two-component system LytT family response regulator